MISYKILQLSNGNDKLFMDYTWLKEPVNIDEYIVIYEGQLNTTNDPKSALDEIYMIHQGLQPEGYNGRSVSVSDIIDINDKRYYVDSFGFVEI